MNREDFGLSNRERSVVSAECVILIYSYAHYHGEATMLPLTIPFGIFLRRQQAPFMRNCQAS